MSIKKYSNIINEGIGSTLFTGYCPVMPGTASSLFIILLYPWISEISFLIYLISLFFILIFSIFSYPYFENNYQKDPACFTMDETMATYILIYFIHRFQFNIFISFIIWRVLDITKPFLIKRVEKLKGFIGVMLDDILAIIYTIVICFLIQYLF